MTDYFSMAPDDLNRWICSVNYSNIFTWNWQVRPANRGPGFNQTRITSSLKAVASKDLRAFGQNSFFNETRRFNLTSFGGMGFLGGTSMGNLSFLELSQRTTPNTSVLAELPQQFGPSFSPYRSSLRNFGGMNFLGGTGYNFRSLADRFNAARVVQTNRYTEGFLRDAGAMSFLGNTPFKPGSFSFTSSGLQQPSNRPQQSSFSFNYGNSLGVVDAMGILGAQYRGTTIPSRTLVLQRNAAFSPAFGPTMFIGGLGGLPFTPRTTPAPLLRPLPHFKQGSLLSQIPLTPATKGLAYQQQNQGKAVLTAPQKPFLGATTLQSGDVFISFQGTGSTIRFGFPQSASGTSTHRSSLPKGVKSVSQQVFGARERLPVAPPPRPVPIPVSPPPSLVPSRIFVPSSPSKTFFTLTGQRTRNFEYGPRPLNVEVSRNRLPSQSGSTFVSQNSPARPLPVVQQTAAGPATSYTTGTTFFSIGSASSTPLTGFKVPQTTSRLGRPYHDLTFNPNQVPQRRPSLVTVQPLQKSAYLIPPLKSSFKAAQLPSARSPPARIPLTSPVQFANSQSSPKTVPVKLESATSFRDQRKRVSYGYRPYSPFSSPSAAAQTLDEINEKGFQFGSHISFSTPTAQFSIGRPTSTGRVR